MPLKKEKLLSPFQRLFSRPPSPNPPADGSGPDIPPGPQPTVEEAKATQKHSRAYEHLMGVCRGFTALVKLVEPCLEGTPFQAPASVFIAIAKTMQTSKDTKESADAALDGLTARLQDVSKYFAEFKDDESQLMLDEYAKELVCAAREIDAILNPSRLQVLDVEGNKSKLENIVDRIDTKTNNFHFRILLAIERDTKDIRDRLFKSDLRSWNRAPSAQYKADAIENQPKRQACTEGTRVDILQRITDWATNPSSPIFWLSGMAGSGKSTIAYSVCRFFSKNTASKTALGASFFCSRQVADLRRLGNIAPTLAYQLAHHSRSFATALDHANPDIVYVSSEQVEKLLLEPWKSSEGKRCPEFPSTLIVIDALDEIEEDKGAELLQNLIEVTVNLKRSQKNARQLKILVTSRPHPHIVSASGLLEPDSVYRLESIGKSQGREDILKFLTDKLRDLVLHYNHLLERLADRADGLFIYAATVVRILSSTYASSGMTRKEKHQWLSYFLDSPRASSSSDLGAVYDLYKQVLYDAIPEHLRQHRVPILHRIICTVQPLSVNALARILDVDSDSDVDQDAPAMLVQALHAVLYVSNSDGCVYVYHKSFSDFMLDDQISGRELACDVNAQNAGISRACLRIMQTSLRFNICSLSSSYLLDTEVPNLAKSIKINILNVHGLEYACRYWTSHLVKVSYSDENARILCEQLLKFTNEKVLFWLEVINLLKAIVDANDGLRAVVAWVNNQRDAPVELRMVLPIVLRLAQSFFWTAASTSTPHLYISCLATEFAMHHDFPSIWKDDFTRVPQISCAGVSSQGRVLTRINAKSMVHSVAFSPDGTRVVSGSYDNTLRIWDASTGQEMDKLDGHKSSVNSVAFSSNGMHIVTGSDDNFLRGWDTSTGVKVHMFEDNIAWVRSVAFSPDDTRIVTGSDDNFVRVWEISTGAQVHKIDGHVESVQSVAFSPNGLYIVSGSRDQSVRIWDATSGAEVLKFNGHTGWVNSVAFSPNSTRVVSSSVDQSMRIWDASTGAEVHKLCGHGDIVDSAAFSPDGTQVVSGSMDRSVRIWDAFAGTEVHRLNGHTNRVISVVFSPDGWRVVSGSWDNTVRIWDALTGTEVQNLVGHLNYVSSVAFSSDGRRIASSSWDKSVRLWDGCTADEGRKSDWRLDPQTGWVTTTTSSDRLLWIPTHLHVSLYDGKTCTLVISQAGRTRVDFSGACVGPECARCYQPR